MALHPLLLVYCKHIYFFCYLDQRERSESGPEEADVEDETERLVWLRGESGGEAQHGGVPGMARVGGVDVRVASRGPGCLAATLHSGEKAD